MISSPSDDIFFHFVIFPHSNVYVFFFFYKAEISKIT